MHTLNIQKQQIMTLKMLIPMKIFLKIKFHEIDMNKQILCSAKKKKVIFNKPRKIYLKSHKLNYESTQYEK